MTTGGSHYCNLSASFGMSTQREFATWKVAKRAKISWLLSTFLATSLDQSLCSILSFCFNSDEPSKRLHVACNYGQHFSRTLHGSVKRHLLWACSECKHGFHGSLLVCFRESEELLSSAIAMTYNLPRNHGQFVCPLLVLPVTTFFWLNYVFGCIWDVGFLIVRKT